MLAPPPLLILSLQKFQCHVNALKAMLHATPISKLPRNNGYDICGDDEENRSAYILHLYRYATIY